MFNNRARAAIAIAAAGIIAVAGYFVFASGDRGEPVFKEAEPTETATESAIATATPEPESPIAISIDFGERSDPPLVKKMAQYNAGPLPLENYPRDIGLLEPVDSLTFRIDLGMGAGLDRDFLAKNVITGTAEDPIYDFSSVDSLANMLNELRVLPYYSWAYVPTPLQRDADFRRLNTEIPDWTGKYRNMMREIAKHYRETGIKIGYHEVYNEPDLTEVFFQEPFEKYLDMYRAASVGLREGDPDAVIGGPALAMGESTTNVMDFVEMVEKEKLPLDFFSFHAYWESSPFPAKLDNIRKILGWYESLNTTELHLNELNYVGGWQGADSRLNGSAIVPDILDVLKEVLKETDITMVNWAQFMESTVADDAYGLIHRDGQKKAAYHAFQIYADMPEERVTASFGDDWEAEKEIGVLASANENKAGILLWNRTDEERSIAANLSNLPFEGGQLRLYRIDSEHASALEGAPEDLEIAENRAVEGRNGEWSGVIPANGVVYLAIGRTADVVDFKPQIDEYAFASDVRGLYYFEDRAKDNYTFFDRKQWKFYLGMGSEETARSLVGVTAEQLPETFRVLVRQSDGMTAGSDRSVKSFRVDYEGKDGYVRSVVFHDGMYGPGSGEVVQPFGTRRPADEVVQVDSFAEFTVEPAKHAPKDWTGRVVLSLELRDAGPGARMEVALR